MGSHIDQLPCVPSVISVIRVSKSYSLLCVVDICHADILPCLVPLGALEVSVVFVVRGLVNNLPQIDTKHDTELDSKSEATDL